MIIDFLAFSPLLIVAYAIGYHRGHTAALAVPYQMLADYMAELIRRTQPDKENDTPTTP